MRRLALLLAVVVLVFGVASAPRHLQSRTATNPDFVHFESGQVRPVAFTPSHDRLLVLNTPDDRLTVFDLTQGPPTRNTRIAEIPVGLEPVSVCALDDSTAWVVNNVSDDVSIVNLNTMHVKQTLRVGDEPNDVVFAGSPTRAYVSVSNEDVIKVYDPATLAQTATISVVGRMPRALARNTAGTFVYCAIFQGGNDTSLLPANKVPNDSIPQDTEFPHDSIPGHAPPKTGFIIQKQGANWFDFYGNLWNSKTKYSISDVDVAEINTTSNVVSRNFTGIGTNNFGIAVSPTDGRVAVSTTDSRNINRFEPRVSGYVVETQAGYVTAAGVVSIKKLDLHINYTVTPGTQAEADSAIGTPTALTISADGSRTYITSLATNKVAVLNTFGGPATSMLARIRTVDGPTGVIEDGARHQLYILGRYHNELQTLSTGDFSELSRTSIGMDPTPDAIVNGRKFFYGGFTSAHGDQSCASCHVFGDMDNMVWDLGDPNGTFVPPPSPNPLGLEGSHPMKGPMATQTLRGMTNTEPFHWRGDRSDLSAFNNAFVTLMGRAAPLADSEMTAFNDFVMPLSYPPNPAEHLDRTMPDAPPGQPSALRGQDFFMNQPVDGPLKCNDCHSAANNGPGTNRQMVPASALFESQDLKVPQLRNQYKKTGFRDVPGWINKRGFGYTHDGSVDSLVTFLHAPQFLLGGPTGDATRADLEAFLHAFDTGVAPSVGYQLTFDGPNDNDATAASVMDTLEAQAALDNCDLIAKGRVNDQPRGWEYVGGGMWQSDKAAEAPISSADLRALGGLGSELTVSGVPKGSGHRMGVDRDRDGYLDGDELDVLSDPGNPDSTPGNVSVNPPANRFEFAMRGVRPNPFRDATEVAFTLGAPSRVDVIVYDVLGRQVRGVAKGLWLQAGPQTLRWDGRDASGRPAQAGVYFVRVNTARGQWTRPVVRVR